MEAAFILVRWAHFESTLLLFGFSVFVAYATKTVQTARALRRRASRALIVLACVTFASALAWWSCAAGTMTGQPSQTFVPQTLLLVLTATSFGHVWALRLALAAATVAVAWTGRSGHAGTPALLAVCSSALAVTIAGTGHAAAQPGIAGILRRAEDALHLTAAGLWMGGLLGLALLLAATTAAELPRHAVISTSERVSSISLYAIVVLWTTGIVNAIALVGSWNRLFATDYGRLLCAKVLLFCIALGIAAINRFFALRRLRSPEHEETALRRGLLLEHGVIALVVLAVAVFGTLPPPSSGV